MIGFLINNRYIVRRLLGEGGMGKVFLVEDWLDDNRLCALKTLQIRPDKQAQALEHFKNEFEALARLRHPNLAEVYDFGHIEETGEYFFTAEYVEGEDLLTAAQHFSWDHILEAVVGICQALDYIHAQGFIHYDIKPGNIRIRHPQAGEGEHALQVKLLDFGLAGKRMTMGRVKGSLRYLSPEMLLGQEVDHLTDLYSLGAVFYELVTRTPLFDGNSNQAIIRQHLSPDTTPPSALRPDLPPGWEPIILRLLAKNSSQRFPNASEVIRAINQATGRNFAFQTQAAQRCSVTQARFVGRTKEWELLKDILRQHLSGPLSWKHHIRLVVVSGEKGIGKSRLLREFRIHAQLSQVPFFSADCHATLQRPYEPLAQLVRQLFYRFVGDPGWFAGTPQDQARILSGSPEGLPATSPPDAAFAVELCASHREELAYLLPELRQPSSVPGKHWQGEEGRHRFYHGLVHFIFALARRHPLVCHFGDVHWADNGMREFLGFLARELLPTRGQETGPQLLIILTFREETSSPSEIFPWLKNPGVCHLPLRGLEFTEVRELLASMLAVADFPPDFSEKLARETLGNPFFLGEVMETLLATGKIQYGEQGWKLPRDASTLAIPGSLAEVLTLRLQPLSPRSRRVLEGLAVWNRPAPLSLFGAALGRESGELLSLLSRLVSQRLLAFSDEDLTYTFSHALLREHIYHRIGPATRTAWHRRLAKIMEKDPGPDTLDTVAFHFLRSGASRKAVHYAVLAGRRARKEFSPQRAMDFLEEALTLIPVGTPSWINLSLESCEVGLEAGSYEKILARCQELVPHLSSRAPRRQQARLAWLLGEAFGRQGDFHRALIELNHGLDLVENRHHPSELLRLYESLAGVYLKQEAYAKCRLQVLRCLEMMETTPELSRPSEKAALFDVLGQAFSAEGRLEDALNYFQRSWDLAQRHGDLIGVARAMGSLGVAQQARGDRETGSRYFSRAMELWEKIGDLGGMAQGLEQMGRWAGDQGEIREAISYYRRSLELREKTGEAGKASAGYRHLADLYRQTGKGEQAAAALSRGLPLAQAAGLRREILSLLLDQASLLWFRGEAGRALSLLGELDKRTRQFSSPELAWKVRLLIAEAGIFLACPELFDRFPSSPQARHGAPNPEDLMRYWRLAGLKARLEGQPTGEAAQEMARLWQEQAPRTTPREQLAMAGDWLEFAYASGQAASPLEEEWWPRLGHDRERLGRFYLWKTLLRERSRLEEPELLIVRHQKVMALLHGFKPLPLLWQSHWAMGRLSLRQGKLSEAGRHYQQALRTLSTLYTSLPATFRARFLGRADLQQLREEAVSLAPGRSRN